MFALATAHTSPRQRPWKDPGNGVLIPRTRCIHTRTHGTLPQGWNSWNLYACNIHEDIVRATADALVASGLRDLGFVYVTIDDCMDFPLSPVLLYMCVHESARSHTCTARSVVLALTHK